MHTDYTELINALEAIENAIRQTVLNGNPSQTASDSESVEEIGGIQ